MDLSEFTIKELEEEIEKRKKVKPYIKNSLEEFTEEEIKYIANFISKNFESIIDEGYVDDDFYHCCFEILLELFCGKKIWSWYNEQMS